MGKAPPPPAVILEESERTNAIALRDLLNGGRPATDDLGYLMWDRCYGMCNPQCWQWELACRHSACVNQILRKAGIDWPEDGLPDIDLPTITISTAISRERNRRTGESPEPSRPGDETRGMSQTPVPDGAYDPVIPADPRLSEKQRGRIVNLMREAYRQGVAQAMSQFGIET